MPRNFVGTFIFRIRSVIDDMASKKHKLSTKNRSNEPAKHVSVELRSTRAKQSADQLTSSCLGRRAAESRLPTTRRFSFSRRRSYCASSSSACVIVYRLHSSWSPKPMRRTRQRRNCHKSRLRTMKKKMSSTMARFVV